jgi:hypothetical protein
MFSFRSDKTGFFVTLILTTLAAGTVIATLVLLIVGWAQGEWARYLLSVKWVLGSAWVLSIIIVLVRVKIFQFQRRSIGAGANKQAAREASSGENEAS